MKRRWAESDAGGFPWREIFKGQVLDVGSGDDGIRLDDACTTYFDLPDGGGDDLRKFFPNALGFYDVIHGSQVLEHMLDPVKALESWIDLVRPGGHIIATVPDWELYEKQTWPSKWNAGHRSIWSLDHDIDCGREACQMCADVPHCKLPEWLKGFPVDVIRCQLIDANYDYSVGPDVDQTFDAEKGAEAFIEFVLKKPMI